VASTLASTSSPFHTQTKRRSRVTRSPQMSAQSEQIKQNFLNHPYTQQASKFFNGQVSSLDAEVSLDASLVLIMSSRAAEQVPRAPGHRGPNQGAQGLRSSRTRCFVSLPPSPLTGAAAYATAPSL
jgi:receptor expression-enhancing protein 5/6